MNKIFVSSGLKNWRQVREAYAFFEEHGWVNAYEWAKGPMSNADSTSEELSRAVQDELRAIVESDVVLFILTQTRGVHAELGAAVVLCEVGMEKRVYLYSEDPEVFGASNKTAGIYHSKHILRRTGDFGSVLAEIVGEGA